MVQQGPVSAGVIMTNSGTNTVTYRFQEHDGSAWADLGVLGDDTYNTLIAAQTRHFVVSSTYPNVRVLGNASGGAQLDFSVSRFHTRASGAAIPILSF